MSTSLCLVVSICIVFMMRLRAYTVALLMIFGIVSVITMSDETCGVCGYTFKPGDFVHELEIGRQVEKVCDMCYHSVLRRR